MISPKGAIASEWVILTLSYIFVGARFTVRIKHRQTNLIWSEIMLFLGALWLLGLVVCDTITYQHGAMADFYEVSVDIKKVRFAENYFFDAGLYFPKLSMVIIYFHLLPRHELFLRWALYFVAAFTVACFVFTIFVDTFWCGSNVAVNWSPDPDACSTFSAATLFGVNWSLCFTTEAMLFFLPFPLFRSLRHSQRKDLAGLIILFSLGLITLGVSAGRFATMLTLGNDLSLYIWATTEFGVAQMIVASMALRPLFKKMWRTISGSSKSHGATTSDPTNNNFDNNNHNNPKNKYGVSNNNAAHNYAAGSRQKSSAKVYGSRSAVRISEHRSGGSGSGSGMAGMEDVWDENSSEVELQAYLKQHRTLEVGGGGGGGGVDSRGASASASVRSEGRPSDAHPQEAGLQV